MIDRFLGAAERSRIGYAVAEGKLLLARCAQARGSEERAGSLLGEALADAGHDGLPMLRREIHTALASVSGQDSEQHAAKARELTERIVESVSGEPLAARFRASATGELGVRPTP